MENGQSEVSAGFFQTVRHTFVFEGDGGLKDRLLTALLVLTVALLLSVAALLLPFGRSIAVALTGLIAVLCSFEVVRLFARQSDTLAYRRVFGVVRFVVLALPALAAMVVGGQAVLDNSLENYRSWEFFCVALLLSAVGLLVCTVVEGRNSLEVAQRDASSFGPAFLLVSVCAPQLVLLSSTTHGVQLLWWLTAVVALNDAAAFFVGRAFGKTKIAPALSPNKTVVGSLAGLLVGAVAGPLFWSLLLGGGGQWSEVLCVACGVTVSAQSADLAKSYLKRLRGVKDTGALFPGHGGVLDRFDGMIGGAPLLLFGVLFLGLA
jgi:phosphatidate cytidylyltransferase